MSFRRKVVLAAALAFSIWGFSRDASTAEPREKPLPPFAKFAQGLFSNNQESDTSVATEEVRERPGVTISQESISTSSPQDTPKNSRPASTAAMDSTPIANPSILSSRKDESSLRATVEKLKSLRKSDSTLENQRNSGSQTAGPASQSASQSTVESPSETETKIPISELPGADLEAYSTPPYPTKITHRGLTDQAPTRIESLRNALRRLQQERQVSEIPQANLAENHLRDQSSSVRLAESKSPSHDDVPIANAIAGDLEARPVVRPSEFASRPSQQGNPLRERGPEYRSLRVSDWQETPTSTESMTTAMSPATIRNRFVDGAEQADKAVVASSAKRETQFQFSPPIDELYIAEESTPNAEETPFTSTQFAQNTITNPYAENDSPRLDTEQTGIVSPPLKTYFANPRDAVIPPQNSSAPDSEGAYTKILNQTEAPTTNLVLNKRPVGDDEGSDNTASNNWITPAASIANEGASLQTELPNGSNLTIVAPTAPAENSEPHSPTTESKASEPPPTSYRTMTFPTHSRSLIRPGRVVEVASPMADPQSENTSTSKLEENEQEVIIERSSDSTTLEQESRPARPRRGAVIKPSPRPIAVP